MRSKMMSLKCPHCGANLEIDGELEVFYCRYCGTKIQAEYISKNEMRIREMEHEEAMSEKEEKTDRLFLIIVGVLVSLAFLLLIMLLTKYL